MEDPRLRFSGKAEDYARHRPGYPPEALAFLAERCGLTSRWAANLAVKCATHSGTRAVG